MKLISMTDFVLENQDKIYNKEDSGIFACRVINYANFLKQPLKLEMFVPCNESENVLKPCGCSSDKGTCKKEYDYQKAKEKVLFEGFKDIEAIDYHISRNRTIEYLSKFSTIDLTQNAIKQFM